MKRRTIALIVAGVGSAAIVGRQAADDWLPNAWSEHKGPIVLGLVAVAFACQWAGGYLANRRPPIVRRLLHSLWEDSLGKAQDVRVTLMAVKSPAWWRTPGFVWRRETQPTDAWAEATDLRQPPEGKRSPVVRFSRGQGVVGLAWLAHAAVEHQNMPDFENDESGYLSYCKGTLRLPAEKVERLGKKCRSYVCAPIFDGSDSSNIRGFVSVDSDRAQAFLRYKVSEIETFAKMLGQVMYGGGGP